MWGVLNIVEGDASGCDYDYTEKSAEKICRDAAKILGLSLGYTKESEYTTISYPFSSTYDTKGCYAYGSGTYKGHVFFGTGGTLAEMKALPTTEGQYRLPQDPLLIACLRVAANREKLTFVSAGDYETRGCYAYRMGRHKNEVYYGYGGTYNARKSKTLRAKKYGTYRPTGFDDCNF